MLLIADSGSTKTSWRYITRDKQISQHSTQGFNPYFQNTAQIADELRNVLVPELRSASHPDPEQVFFYGAGCSNEEKCKVVYLAIKDAFPKAEVEIHHDLLGAARATCGRQPGIAAILGTGSNSCSYDGEDITEHIPSLGYILGDEGSGAHLGKNLISGYLYRELPDDLDRRFRERFNLNKDEVLESIYKKPLPNRYLATFSKFIFQNMNDPWMLKMVTRCFSEFFDHHICKYSNYDKLPMHVVGSVGFYYSNILRAIATERGVLVDKILEAPIAGLTLYHLNEG